MISTANAALEVIRQKWPQAAPQHAMVLGSGWGPVTDRFDLLEELPYDALPGLGRPTVSGHGGRLLLTRLAGLETLVFAGRHHWYEGRGWEPVAMPIALMKLMGVNTLLLTNAAGSLHAELSPGALMIIRDHINAIGANPLAGPHDPFWGERFPDMGTVYNPHLRSLLRRAGKNLAKPPAEGVYLAVPGPAYETPAEVRTYREWGADAVGMSTVPEAMLAHAAGISVCALSCLTNFAAGISGQRLSHDDVRRILAETIEEAGMLMKLFWELQADEK